MITAHFGVAGAAWRAHTSAPLALLLAASVAPDVLDVAYALAGVCSPYGLYSHTVPAAVVLAAVLGGGTWLAVGSRGTAALVTMLVLVHLPGDLVTGRKLFWPGGELYGLGVYQYGLLDFAIETPIALAGWWVVRRSPAAPRWARSILAAVALVAIQGVLDALSGDGSVKPTACGAVTAGERAGQLVPSVTS